jgi:hypothetical protein
MNKMLKTAIFSILFFLSIPVVMADRSEKPENPSLFYARTSVVYLANQLHRGETLGNPGRDIRELEGHLDWASRQDIKSLREELSEKFNRMVDILAEHRRSHLSEWYADICVKWAQWGVNFGSPGANNRDWETHRNWAMRQPIQHIRDQLLMRIDKIFASYSKGEDSRIEAIVPEKKVRLDPGRVIKMRSPTDIRKLCDPNPSIIITKVPVESGKKVYIWPDDSKGKSLKDFAAYKIRNGDTLYFRPGTFKGPIVTSGKEIIKPDPKSVVAPPPPMPKFTLERVHIRGSGSGKTTLLGHIDVGKNSTIKDVTVDNRGLLKDVTTIQVNPPGVLIENVVIKGGRNGILVGNDMMVSGSGGGKVILRCVEISNVMFNGIILGDKLGSKVNDCEIGFVKIKETNNMGLGITGDRANVNNLTLTQIGTGGLSIDGENAMIFNSSFSKVKLYAISVKGSSPEIKDVKIQGIGNKSLGTGIIIYQKSNNHIIADNLIQSVRIGILIEGAKGTLSNNIFKNIYFKNVLHSSPFPQPHNLKQ